MRKIIPLVLCGAVLLYANFFDQYHVRETRPRIFLRDSVWAGANLPEIRERLDTPEFMERFSQVNPLWQHPVGHALYGLMREDSTILAGAVTRLESYVISGSSPSYSGIAATECAVLFDWLCHHPDFDSVSRRQKVIHMAQWAETFYQYLIDGEVTPFYSRIPGALAGLTALGLALYGEIPKAAEYIDYAWYFLREKYGTIRQAEDGATGGGCYGFHHVFTDMMNTVSAWQSATSWDAAGWIKEHQGNWLERQMLYQLWSTYPNGYMIKHGDRWSYSDDLKYRMQVDGVTHLYGNPFGQTFLNRIYSRYGVIDLSSEYEWYFHLQACCRLGFADRLSELCYYCLLGFAYGVERGTQQSDTDYEDDKHAD